MPAVLGGRERCGVRRAELTRRASSLTEEHGSRTCEAGHKGQVRRRLARGSWTPAPRIPTPGGATPRDAEGERLGS